ncbi:MAG: hypothetical protein SCALA702_38160 [Melioribacteraceae bacterium]|nr:MAG: hypothetical protein SCALA702_38160 [Melioribacteraceae bacterium]
MYKSSETAENLVVDFHVPLSLMGKGLKGEITTPSADFVMGYDQKSQKMQ